MYKSLLTLFAAFSMFTTSAATVNFTVNVATPEAVSCTVNGEEREVTAGDNDFTVEEYTAVKFASVAPWYITEVVNQAGTPSSVYGGEWSIYPSTYDEGSKYTIKTKNLDEARVDDLTINVDDASLVRASLTGYNTTLELVNGENKIKFDSAVEEYLNISSTNGKPIYEVKQNGTAVTDNYGQYQIKLAANDVIDITAAIPDKDVTVTFAYNETGVGAIKSVSIDGTEVENFDGTTLAMKAGQELSFIGSSDYKIDSATIDGTTISWTGEYAYRTTVMNDMAIAIEAHPYGKINYTVKVDDPQNIIFYRGYEYQNDIVELQAGENQLQISEVATSVTWKAADGCFITSVTIDGTPYEYGSSTNVTEGMVIEFVTGKIVKDKTAIVWIDSKETADAYFSLEGYDRTPIEIENGYNTIPFYDGMIPFHLSWYSNNPSVNQVYINDELIDPMYEGSTSYELIPEDGDVIKIFLAQEATLCNVAFTGANDVEATATADLVKNVDMATTFTCLSGTQFSISGDKISVSVGGTEIAADADGNYTFTVIDTDTEVVLAQASSVSVITGQESIDDMVYSITGVAVGTRASLCDLAPGVYICNGKKLLVK